MEDKNTAGIQSCLERRSVMNDKHLIIYFPNKNVNVAKNYVNK